MDQLELASVSPIHVPPIQHVLKHHDVHIIYYPKQLLGHPSWWASPASWCSNPASNPVPRQLHLKRIVIYTVAYNPNKYQS